MELNDLILRLYRISHELTIDRFQDEALGLVKRVLPFDSSMWGTATTAAAGIDIHTCHLHHKSPEMVEAYEKLKHQDIAAASVFGKPCATHAFHSQSVFAAADKRDIREFLRHFKQENFFVTSQVDVGRNFMHWISLYRADKDAHCSERERLLLEKLSPHVMQSLAFNRVAYLDSRSAGDLALSPHGSAICDLRGVIYHANPQFVSLAQSAWSGWLGGRLPAIAMQHLAGREACFLGATLFMRCHVEQGLLFIKARNRCPADLLTARERCVAALVAQGNSHKEVAVKLKRSPATIRNQIQAIYEKLHVNGIAGLIDELQRAR